MKFLYSLFVSVLSVLIFTKSVAANCLPETSIPSSTPTSRFIDHGDGTITDIETQLMWAKCTEALTGSGCTNGRVPKQGWKQALELANSSTLAGHVDWRLPNVNELRSIVEGRCYRPAINPAVFPNTPVTGFWSSSPIANHIDRVWVVYFEFGRSTHTASRAGTENFRLVRNAQ